MTPKCTGARGCQFRQLTGQGVSIRHICIDSELKSAGARRSERARVRESETAAESVKVEGRFSRSEAIPLQQMSDVRDGRENGPEADGALGHQHDHALRGVRRFPCASAPSKAKLTRGHQCNRQLVGAKEND